MINDSHEPLVNSISDQTFRFNYINWLLSEWVSGQSFQSSVKRNSFFFFWILAMTGWWSDDIFVRHGRECFQSVTLSITEWISLSRLYRQGTHPRDYTRPEYIYQGPSTVWEARKKCSGNVLTLTCDLCLDIMAGGGAGAVRPGRGWLWWMSVIRVTQWRSQPRHGQHPHLHGPEWAGVKQSEWFVGIITFFQ